jgi:hypothetical protein
MHILAMDKPDFTYLVIGDVGMGTLKVKPEIQKEG